MHPSTTETEPAGPLDGVRIENGGFVNDNGTAEIEPEASAIPDRFVRLYSAEKLARHIGGLLGWVGRRKGLESLQGRTDDPDFRSACEVVHRRLVARVGERVLDALGDEAFEDVVVIVIGFGPIWSDCMAEISEKRKAARSSADDDGAAPEGVLESVGGSDDG
ncbi:MAG: hypothetical protein RLW87_07970 [Alphaproteobacteria bacterium]